MCIPPNKTNLYRIEDLLKAGLKDGSLEEDSNEDELPVLLDSPDQSLPDSPVQEAPGPRRSSRPIKAVNRLNLVHFFHPIQAFFSLLKGPNVGFEV